MFVTIRCKERNWLHTIWSSTALQLLLHVCVFCFFIFQENLAPFLRTDHKNIFEAKQFVVWCEGSEVVTTTTFLEGITLLVESYWVFDMQYPKQGRDIFSFIDCALLKIKTVKPTRCVTSVIAKMTWKSFGVYCT